MNIVEKRMKELSLEVASKVTAIQAMLDLLKTEGLSTEGIIQDESSLLLNMNKAGYEYTLEFYDEEVTIDIAIGKVEADLANAKKEANLMAALNAVSAVQKG